MKCYVGGIWEYVEFKNTDKWNVSGDLCQHFRAKYLGINALKKHYQRSKN